MTKLITIFDKDLNQRVFRLFYENEIEHKIDTILSISSSSSSIDVGDSVVISGVLTDENSTPLGGMSVKILRNNSVIDTVTTNSSGVYTKTVSGLNIGTYHFHAVYDGNDTYDNAISSTIDVSVVGHTYVVTIASDKQTALVGDNVTISGTLTRDGVGYGGQSVRIFDDGVLLDTVTTDNNGDYTKTISNLTLGTHRYSSQFDAVESNIAIVEVTNHLYNIDITADNPIIESGDTATITATLTDNTVPVVGETLSYTVSHDSTTIDSGTLTTGSNGSASFSYNGTGVGDVTIEIDYSTLLQETYKVEDCVFYDPLTSNSGKWTIPSGVSFGYNEYSSDGWKLGNASSFVFLDPNVSLTLPCKVSFKLIDRYNYTPQLNVGNDYVEFNDTHLNIDETNLYATISNNKEYSFIIRSDSIEAYQDDTYIGKANISISQTNLRLSVGNNRYFKIKDFKVKAL